VVPGDRVATLMRNRIEVPIIYLAAMSIGAIAVPLNPRRSTPTAATARQRITDALGTNDGEPEPGGEEDCEGEMES